MSYKYEDLKPALLTEDGFTLLQKILDRGKRMTLDSGCFTCGRVIDCETDIGSWTLLAAVDFLVERGYFKLLLDPGVTQHQIFMALVEQDRSDR